MVVLDINFFVSGILSNFCGKEHVFFLYEKLVENKKNDSKEDEAFHKFKTNTLGGLKFFIIYY